METIKTALEFYLRFAAFFLAIIIFILLLWLGVKLPLKIKDPYIRILTLATISAVFLAPHILLIWAPHFLLLSAGSAGGGDLTFIHGLYPFLATWILLVAGIYLLWGKKWIREKKRSGSGVEDEPC